MSGTYSSWGWLGLARSPRWRAGRRPLPMMQWARRVRASGGALAKGDKVAANKWLDPDFTWIDSEGIMWAKTDAFRAGLKPLVVVGTDTKIIEHKYGKSVVWIPWNQGNKYSARFWVKRPTGWKLLHTTEIATMPKRDFQTVDATFDIPCNNPCKAVPYKP